MRLFIAEKPSVAKAIAAEQQARAGRIGLWADAHPIKPSLFRKTEQ
jgi:endonuclease YncB( thermonuclease family)